MCRGIANLKPEGLEDSTAEKREGVQRKTRAG